MVHKSQAGGDPNQSISGYLELGKKSAPELEAELDFMKSKIEGLEKENRSLESELTFYKLQQQASSRENHNQTSILREKTELETMVRTLRKDNAMLENKLASFNREFNKGRVHFDDEQVDGPDEGPRGNAPMPANQSRPRSPSLARSKAG